MQIPTARPPAFTYIKISRNAGAELCCERVPLTRLAEKFGTPLYVYSGTTIAGRFRVFNHAFRRMPHTVCYSVKANSNLTILRMLAKLGSGFDVVSGGELERVLHVAWSAAKRVVFSGVGKTEPEMDAALQAGILMFNVESESELERLAECAARRKKIARVALRVNPDVPAETHPYIATGMREHKFGVPIGEAERIYSRAARVVALEIAGVSVHIGSQITSNAPFGAAMERVAELVRKLHGAGHQIRYVDAGGGLGIPYEGVEARDNSKRQKWHDDFENRAEAYANAVMHPLRGLKLHLLLEPGRSIIGPAGALLARVVYVKRNGAKRFVVVDAAMNDLIRPSLYNAYHEIVPVAWRGEEGRHGQFDIVGPICETGDFFARDRELPELREGELVALLDAGAYGMSISSNYNTRPRAAEVMVEGKKTRVIRRREKISGLWREEEI